MLRRLLATAAAALPLACLVAAPASASPEDGQGCAGTPDIPAAYVCVVSLTPAQPLPAVTTTHVPVTVPRVCYYADCTDRTTVLVPVPGYTPGSGYAAVLYWNGRYYPIGL